MALKSKKAQIDTTLTWIPAMGIIFLILTIFTFVSYTLFKINGGSADERSIIVNSNEQQNIEFTKNLIAFSEIYKNDLSKWADELISKKITQNEGIKDPNLDKLCEDIMKYWNIFDLQNKFVYIGTGEKAGIMAGYQLGKFTCVPVSLNLVIGRADQKTLLIGSQNFVVIITNGGNKVYVILK